MVKTSFVIYKNITHWRLQLHINGFLTKSGQSYPRWRYLTYWGRVTHICVGNDLTAIGSDNGVSSGWRQAINWTNAGILLIGPLGTNFSEILIQLVAFAFKKMHLKVSIAKWRLYCLGINVLKCRDYHLPFLHCQGSHKVYCFGQRLIQVMTCCLICAKSFPEPVLTYCSFDLFVQTQWY